MFKKLTNCDDTARGAHLAAEYNNNLTRFNPPPTAPSGLQNSKTSTPNIIQLDSF